MAKQRAFILYMTTWGTDRDEVMRDTNLDDLNELLDKGWKVEMTSPMSGHGEDDDETRSLVVLQR